MEVTHQPLLLKSTSIFRSIQFQTNSHESKSWCHGGQNLNYFAVLQLRHWSQTSHSTFTFDSGVVHIESVVEKMALGRLFYENFVSFCHFSFHECFIFITYLGLKKKRPI
jgi:hypothetical protein